MRAVRLGSYSMLATRAATPILFRLKSMRRNRRLWPPPRKRDVTRPKWLRPPVLAIFSVRDRTGRLPWVSSAKSGAMRPRLPGVVGSCWRRPMKLHSFEELDVLAGGERHDRLFPGSGHANEPAHSLFLPADDGGANVDHAHVPQLLDRVPDLDLVGVARHLEEQLRLDRLRIEILAGLTPGLLETRALLGEQRALDDFLG